MNENLILFFSMTGLLNGLGAIIIGLIVFLKRKRSVLHIIFALLNVVIAIWALSYWRWLLADNHDQALFWVRMLSIGSTLIPVLFLHWILVLINEAEKKKLLLILCYIMTAVFLSVSFSSMFVKDVKEVFGFPYWPEPGFIYHLYVLFSYITLLGYGIYKLFKVYRTTTGYKRDQLRYVFLGLAIAAPAGFSNFPLWYNINFPPYFNIFVLAYMSCYAYAILKHRLMDIRIVLTEFLVGSIAFVLLIETFLSRSLYEVLFRTTIFLIFCIFGYLLIKSVINEIKRRMELERLTRELKIAYGKLEKLDKAKSDFISIASHQLRTPLTAIKAYVSMILEGTYGKMDRRIKDKMKRVFISSDRLTNLVNNLLNVSRIEAGKMEVELEKVDLENIISDLVKELNVKAEKKAIYLKFKKRKRKLPDVLIDKNKIKEVIINLIDNAIKYTQKGGVIVKTQTHDSKVRVIVSDTGIGIIPKEAGSLFDSFTRGQTGSLLNTEGLGLGLYIAKRFIEMQNGKIWAESKGKGKGSTFYIELPTK